MPGPVHPRGFDIAAFFDAIDQRRRHDALSWAAVARQMAQATEDLAAQCGGHPIAASTITNMPRRGNTTCQHALVMLRWLERAPEEFIARPRPGTSGVPLPEADPAHSLRWNLPALHAALDDVRRTRGATWEQAALRLYCSPHQLTGLRTARYATNMRLAMRICQALGRPAADFVYAADW